MASLDEDTEMEELLRNSSRGSRIMDVVKRRESSIRQSRVEQNDNCCTPNIRALGISCFLFALITVLQVFAAEMANSKALMMDCVSMGVDAFTYLGNIMVELRKRHPQSLFPLWLSSGSAVKSQLLVVCLSLGLLCYFTYDGMTESYGKIQQCRGTEPYEEEEEVNGWITLLFAVGGVLFDVVCMIEFYKSNQQQASGKQVNMFAAFLHVGADFIRSASTTVMSLVILLSIGDSTCVDAYVSMLIGISIIGGACVGFFEWFKLLAGYVKGDQRMFKSRFSLNEQPTRFSSSPTSMELPTTTK